MELYVLFSCDEWKSKSSMRLMGVFTTVEALWDTVCKLVEADDMEWSYNPTGQDPYSINSALKYGHINTVTSNELI